MDRPGVEGRTFCTAALVTVIADREADIYELFARLPDAQTHLLVRAMRDRAGRRRGLCSANRRGARSRPSRLRSSGRPGRMARRVMLAVRFREVALRQPSAAPTGAIPATHADYHRGARTRPPPGEIRSSGVC